MSDTNNTVPIESREQPGETTEDLHSTLEQAKADALEKKALVLAYVGECGIVAFIKKSAGDALKAAGSNIMSHVNEDHDALTPKDGLELLAKCQAVYDEGMFETLDKVVDLLATHYTLEEMREIVAFYRSPIGQKHLRVQTEAIKPIKQIEHDFAIEIQAPAKNGLREKGHSTSLADAILGAIFLPNRKEEEKTDPRKD
jgi:hypothetical protein